LIQGLALKSTGIGTLPGEVTIDLDPSRVYTVNLMYARLTLGAELAHFKDIWAANLLLKIHIFTWKLVLDHLPSTANLVTR
jgi:hypothetical protein